MTKANDAMRQEAITELRKIFKPGDTLFAIVRSVARSGMSRRMDYYAMQDGELRWITPLMVKAGVPDESWASWRKRRDYEGARIDGCGMDMIFESAYRLGHLLFARVEGERDTGYALKYRSL